MATHIQLQKPTAANKKHKMVFFKMTRDGLKRIKSVHFGQRGASDFTQHRNQKQRKSYLARHKVRENWNDPFAAGTLARYVLWNKGTIESSVRDYAKRFNLKLV